MGLPTAKIDRACRAAVEAGSSLTMGPWEKERIVVFHRRAVR